MKVKVLQLGMIGTNCYVFWDENTMHLHQFFISHQHRLIFHTAYNSSSCNLMNILCCMQFTSAGIDD